MCVELSSTSLGHPLSECLVIMMVRHFTFNKPLLQISQVEWCFILDGIKLLVFASSFSSIHCFLMGFHHHDLRGRVSILCYIDLCRICAKFHFTWLKSPNLVNTEACVIRASIRSNTEIRGREFYPLLSSISFTMICCVLALVFLVLAEISISLKGTNPKPALEGLTTTLVVSTSFEFRKGHASFHL